MVDACENSSTGNEVWQTRLAKSETVWSQLLNTNCQWWTKATLFFFAFCHPPCPILSISEYWTASGFGTEKKKRARLCTLRKILLEKMISMYGTFCTHFVFGNKTECYLVTQRVRQDWPFCDISVCGQFRCVVWATGSLHSQIFLCSCRFHAKHGSRYEWNRISSRLMWAVIATIFCIMS